MIPVDALPYLNGLRDLPMIGETAGVRYSISRGIDRAVVVLSSADDEALTGQFPNLLRAAQTVLMTPDEPLMNILCSYEKGHWLLTVFLRRKHRPDAYYAHGDERIFISPGAVDMAGAVVTPKLIDFERLDCAGMRSLYREVSLDDETVNKIIKEVLK
jgi:hypothetical protein